MPPSTNGWCAPSIGSMRAVCVPGPDEDGVVVLAEVLQPVDLGAGVDRDAQHLDLVEFLLEQLGRQPVGRNAVAQHAAGVFLRLEDLDLVAVGAQVVGRGQARRAGADDADALAAVGRDLGPGVAAVGQAMLGGLGLQRPDEDGAVVAAAHAGRFARRRADQAAGQRQRVVAADDLDRGAVVAVAQVGHEARDVDVGRAGAVAGRGMVAAGPGTAPSGQDSRRTCCSHCARKWRSELPSGQAAARPCAARSSASSSSAARWPASPRPSVISVVSARHARQQAAHRGRFALGQLPVAVQRAPRLLDHAHAGGHHHQAGRRRHDAGRRESQRLAARSACDSGRKPPRPSSKTSTGSSPCTSTPPPQPSIRLAQVAGARRTRPGRAGAGRGAASAATHRGRGVRRRRTAARCGTRSRACAPAARRRPQRASAQQLGLQLRCMSMRRLRRPGCWPASGWRRRRSGTAPPCRSARPAGATRSSGCRAGPRAISTPSASSQGARSSTAAGPSARASNEVASITSVDGPWPRMKRRQARCSGSPAPPHSASPDCCTRCSRCSGVRDCARVRPGSAAGQRRGGRARRLTARPRRRRASPAAGWAGSGVAHGRSFTCRARVRRAGSAHSVRGADRAPRWPGRRTGSRSRTWSRRPAAARRRRGPCSSRT